MVTGTDMVCKGYIVKAITIDGKTIQVSPRTYHAKSAADQCAELANRDKEHYEKAWVTERIGREKI